MTVFDEAIALAAQADGSWQGHTHPGYANMVGPFGGITAAQAINAVLQHPQRQGEPVALTVNYCAALDDGPFSVVATPVRTNRSTQHWTIMFQQQGRIVLTGTAFTATRRETWADDEHRMPAVPPAAELARADTTKARVAWLKRYDFRFIEGSVPVQWDDAHHHDSRTLLWARDDEPRALDHASLTAMADVFFPRIWRRRARLVPIGTVSMTVYFHADGVRLQRSGTEHLLGQAQAQGFLGGYFDQTAQLWNAAGDLLATTHQVVYYKE
ncbi:MAG: thioesterase family protein [Burkholderiales bacterium]|nr:thioesterase family protein [Burkholderiales bacterium]